MGVRGTNMMDPDNSSAWCWKCGGCGGEATNGIPQIPSRRLERPRKALTMLLAVATCLVAADAEVQRLMSAGFELRASQQYEAAEKKYKEALGVLNKAEARDDEEIGKVWNNLGTLYFARARFT